MKTPVNILALGEYSGHTRWFVPFQAPEIYHLGEALFGGAIEEDWDLFSISFPCLIFGHSLIKGLV